MPQHYTKNTEQAPIFCLKCMLGGKRAYCIPCYERPAAKPEAAPQAEQIDLFRRPA